MTTQRPCGYQRNVFFYNHGDGIFSNISGAVDLDFPDDSRAFALADFDHDGRLEIALKNRTGPQLRILRCEAPSLGNSLALRLRGTRSNRDAIGAVVILQTAEGRQMKILQAGTGFPSQHSKEIFFGLGKAVSASAEISWPSGSVQHWEGLPANHRVEIEEGTEGFQAAVFRPYQPLSVIPDSPAAIAPPADCETWLIDPIQAPDFELPDLIGTPHLLPALRGRTVVLNFWATWSPPSVETLRALDHSPALRTPGLELLAINLDKQQDAAQVRAFVSANSLRLPVLLASDDVAGIYNLVYHFMFDRRRNLGLPTTFLINPKGYVVMVCQGCVDAERLNAHCKHIPQTPEERARLALPFPGKLYLGEFRRNRFTYGAAYSQAGYFDQAIREFNAALETDPKYAEAHYNLETLYLKQGKPDEARRHLLRALELRPEYPDALNNLGLLAAQTAVVVRDGTSTTVDLHLAERASPGPIQAPPNQSQPGYHDDTPLKASAVKTTIDAAGYSSQAESPQRLLTEGPSLSGAAPRIPARVPGSPEAVRAERELKDALRGRPDSFEANHQLGEFYLSVNDLKSGIPYLENAQRMKSDDDANGFDLAVAYLEAKNSGPARSLLQEMLRRKDTAELQNLLGEADEALGDPASAVKEYQLAAHMDPSEQNLFD